MMALVFLYWTASIFIFGGELNSALSRHLRAAREEKSARANRHGQHHDHRKRR
jgi:uncharacterized BrkB/YihY/UPF0761 family membrane protein